MQACTNEVVHRILQASCKVSSGASDIDRLLWVASCHLSEFGLLAKYVVFSGWINSLGRHAIAQTAKTAYSLKGTTSPIVWFSMPLSFFDTSSVGPVSELELQEMKEMVRADSPSFDFDPIYLKVLDKFNGGTPSTRYFRMPDAQISPPIERFLHYTTVEELGNIKLSFFNANVFWSALEDRLGLLVPFAVLANNDALCFDCDAGKSKVVLWSNERSTEEHPSFIHLTDSFEDFCATLFSDFPS